MRFSGFSFRLGKRTRLYFSNPKTPASKTTTASAAPAAPVQQDDPEPRTTFGGIIWRIIVLFITCNWVVITYWRGDLLPFIITIVLAIGAFVLFVGYFFSIRRAREAWEDARIERLIMERKAKEQAAAEAAAKEAERQAKAEARAAEREEYARTHNNLSTKVAGVTFKNADGSSRQANLKDLEVSGVNNVQLVQFEYQGEPALRVVVDGMEIGNVPADIVPEVLEIMPRIDNIMCIVSTFDNDSGRRIYRADLDISYRIDT
nr:MAG TPA: hypothetical protein [Caudoviricetes sp.]